MADLPAYFLTWTTYGSWLHGDERGSVDDRHNTPGRPVLPQDTPRSRWMQHRLGHESLVLNAAQRRLVEDAVRSQASHRRWSIHALNVRTNHVHIVVSASSLQPEVVVQQFKSWATRALRAAEMFDAAQPVWTKMASTRWINDEASLVKAIDYVERHQ